MVNTVFKGDIAEVSWGMETGLVAVGDNASTGFSWTNAANSSTIMSRKLKSAPPPPPAAWAYAGEMSIASSSTKEQISRGL